VPVARLVVTFPVGSACIFKHSRPALLSMLANLAGVRFPHSRVLLQRTRLAYVHLRNLLSDAKRDRAARVSGYVTVWLADEVLVLYLQRGEVVNAARLRTRGSQIIPITEALGSIPAEPEYGEICFHEAEPEQLACMYHAQSEPPMDWPGGLQVTDPTALFPYLLAMTFDGVVEIQADGGMNYLVFKNGTVRQAYLATAQKGSLVERVGKLFGPELRGAMLVRRWGPPPPLPMQAPPALVQAYRELVGGLVRRLGAENASVPAIAEHARLTLAAAHPVLGHFGTGDAPTPSDPVVDTPALSAAVAALVKEVLWAGAGPSLDHQEVLRELTWERRHVFQSAGLFEHLPWKVT
jgi:hypothetical protein